MSQLDAKVCPKCKTADHPMPGTGQMGKSNSWACSKCDKQCPDCGDVIASPERVAVWLVESPDRVHHHVPERVKGIDRALWAEAFMRSRLFAYSFELRGECSSCAYERGEGPADAEWFQQASKFYPGASI